MTKQQLKRIVNRLLGRNKAIDRKAAGVLAEKVLADGLVSRTEKRFLRGLLKRQKLDESARVELHRVLAEGS